MFCTTATEHLYSMSRLMKASVPNQFFTTLSTCDATSRPDDSSKQLQVCRNHVVSRCLICKKLVLQVKQVIFLTHYAGPKQSLQMKQVVHLHVQLSVLHLISQCGLLCIGENKPRLGDQFSPQVWRKAVCFPISINSPSHSYSGSLVCNLLQCYSEPLRLEEYLLVIHLGTLQPSRLNFPETWRKRLTFGRTPWQKEGWCFRLRLHRDWKSVKAFMVILAQLVFSLHW